MSEVGFKRHPYSLDRATYLSHVAPGWYESHGTFRSDAMTQEGLSTNVAVFTCQAIAEL